MKQYLRQLVPIFAVILTLATQGYAQRLDAKKPVRFTEQNLGGPRLGLTYRTWDHPDVAAAIEDPKIISQFGWHFEYLVVPEGGGPSFAIQFIPMVGGVELGKLIPTGTLMFGVRLPEGFEFGIGPNVLLTEQEASTALIIAVGKSIDYGGVSIPIDLAFTTNPYYNRLSLIIGYSIQ